MSLVGVDRRTMADGALHSRAAGEFCDVDPGDADQDEFDEVIGEVTFSCNSVSLDPLPPSVGQLSGSVNSAQGAGRRSTAVYSDLRWFPLMHVMNKCSWVWLCSNSTLHINPRCHDCRNLCPLFMLLDTNAGSLRHILRHPSCAPNVVSTPAVSMSNLRGGLYSGS